MEDNIWLEEIVMKISETIVTDPAVISKIIEHLQWLHYSRIYNVENLLRGIWNIILMFLLVINKILTLSN